jgi:hypothetical protein
MMTLRAQDQQKLLAGFKRMMMPKSPSVKPAELSIATISRAFSPVASYPGNAAGCRLKITSTDADCGCIAETFLHLKLNDLKCKGCHIRVIL